MNKKKRAAIYVASTFALLIIGIVAFALKEKGILDIDCLVFSITGMYCPGCGITRMLQSILNLELYQAFRYNPFIFVSIPFYIYMYIRCGICIIQNGQIKDSLANYILYYAISIIAFGIIRNIEWFSVLAPTKIY